MALIARFHQIAVDPEGLRHQFALVVSQLGEPPRFGDQEILLAAKSLGFKAKLATILRLSDLDAAILLVLAKLARMKVPFYAANSSAIISACFITVSVASCRISGG